MRIDGYLDADGFQNPVHRTTQEFPAVAPLEADRLSSAARQQ
jgi:hypothetical protein